MEFYFIILLGSIESMVPSNHLKEIFAKVRSEGSGTTGTVQHLGVATSGPPDTSGTEGQGGGPQTWSTAAWGGRLGWGCDLQRGCSLNMGAGEASPQNFSPLPLLFHRRSLLDDLPGGQRQSLITVHKVSLSGDKAAETKVKKAVFHFPVIFTLYAWAMRCLTVCPCLNSYTAALPAKHLS